VKSGESGDGHVVFLRRLSLTLLIAIVVWQLLRPTLDSILCGATQALVRAYERPRVTRLVAVDHRAEVRRADYGPGSAVPTIALTEIHFNTIVLIALFLALDKPLSQRQLGRLSVGWSVLLLTQTFNLVFHLKFLYATGMGEWSLGNYSDLSRNAYGFLRYFTDLPGRFSFPFLIWLGFNWQQVMEMLGRTQVAPLKARKRKDRR